MKRNGNVTPREREILDLLISGHNQPAIAEALHLSYGTVKNYLFSLRKRTGTKTMAHLAAWWAAKKSEDSEISARIEINVPQSQISAIAICEIMAALSGDVKSIAFSELPVMTTKALHGGSGTLRVIKVNAHERNHENTGW